MLVLLDLPNDVSKETILAHTPENVEISDLRGKWHAVSIATLLDEVQASISKKVVWLGSWLELPNEEDVLYWRYYLGRAIQAVGFYARLAPSERGWSSSTYWRVESGDLSGPGLTRFLETCLSTPIVRPVPIRHFVGSRACSKVLLTSDASRQAPLLGPRAFQAISPLEGFEKFGYATTQVPPFVLRSATRVYAVSKEAQQWASVYTACESIFYDPDFHQLLGDCRNGHQ
jgi:hypothetical protein